MISIRGSRIFAALALVAALPIAAANAIADTFERAWSWLTAAFNPDPMDFRALDRAGLSLTTGGQALDRALQHDLRHEAGLHRRSAARHC